MKIKYKLKQSTSNFKNHFVRDSKVVVAGTLFMFMLFSIVNVSAVSYKIVYDDNVVSGMPEDVKSTTMNDSVNISSETPARDGYSFLKWCTQVPESDGTCGGTEYAAGAPLSIIGTSKNEYKLYAMWRVPMSFDEAYANAGKFQTDGYYKFQDMSSDICSAVSVGQTGRLIDVRDNTVYNVAKLADSKCWFLDNLALDLTSVTLANLQGNTNASNATLGYLKNGGGSSPYTGAAVANKTSGFAQYNAPVINTASKTKEVTSYGSGNKQIGIYYNYCAASAGSYCYTSGSSTGNATEDICPSNWRMPTGGASGEYQALYIAYAGSATEFRDSLSVPLSGYFLEDSVYSQGAIGQFWSSTYYGYLGYSMYNLYVDAYGGASTESIEDRGTGLPVRCVAK